MHTGLCLDSWLIHTSNALTHICTHTHARTLPHAHRLAPRQFTHPREQCTHTHTHIHLCTHIHTQACTSTACASIRATYTHAHTLTHTQACTSHLDSLRIHKSNVLGKGPEYVGNTLVDATAKIGSGCLIGEFSFPLCALFASVYVFCLCMCVFVCVCVCLSPFHIAMTHLALSNCSH